MGNHSNIQFASLLNLQYTTLPITNLLISVCLCLFFLSLSPFPFKQPWIHQVLLPLLMEPLLHLLFFSSLLISASALTDAEAAAIVRRQLLSLRLKDGELSPDYKFDIQVGVQFANERLRNAYTALQVFNCVIIIKIF